MPKITLPHAGQYFTAFEYFFENIGFEVVKPPQSSLDSIDLGVLNTAAFCCFPFKATIGNLIEVIDDVDVVGMIGGRSNICRLTKYAELYRTILSDISHPVDIFPFKLKKEMWVASKKYNPDLSFREFLYYFKGLYKKMLLVELVRELSLKTRPYEVNPEQTGKVAKKLYREIDNEKDQKAFKSLTKKINDEFAKIETDPNRKTIKIGVVGEFFLLIDQFTTLDMESSLGKMGVELDYSLSFSEFFRGSIKPLKPFEKIFRMHRARIASYAKPYINRRIGGHAMQSVGEAIDYALRKYDGVIHILPFRCMPEIVAQSIMPRVSKDFKIPITSIIIDEQTSEVGLLTRLEAFIDLIMKESAKTKIMTEQKDIVNQSV